MNNPVCGISRAALVVPAFVVLAMVLWPVLASRDARSVELIKDLKCALSHTSQKDKAFCLEVFNTCNTPIVSRIEEQNGVQQDSPEMPAGERGKVCSETPFTFLGHYITGP